MPIHTINQTLDSVTFHKLKHLRDLEIDFTGRNVTGIFGVNGSGKSSILHALARSAILQKIQKNRMRGW